MFHSKRRTVGALPNARLARVLALLLSLCASASAQADAQATSTPPAKQLTSRGRLVIDGGVGGSYSSDRTGGPDALKHWRVYAAPSLTYFLRERIGIGLSFGGGMSESRYVTLNSYMATYRDSHVYLGLSGAFDLPLSDRLSFLFQPELGYTSLWRKDALLDYATSGGLLDPSVIERPNYHQQSVRGVLNVRLLVRMSPSLAIGGGPDLWVDYIVDDGGLRAAQAQRTAFSPAAPEGKYVRWQLGLTVGLWFAL
jgi:hypothetical protein